MPKTIKACLLILNENPRNFVSSDGYNQIIKVGDTVKIPMQYLSVMKGKPKSNIMTVLRLGEMESRLIELNQHRLLEHHRQPFTAFYVDDTDSYLLREELELITPKLGGEM